MATHHRSVLGMMMLVIVVLLSIVTHEAMAEEIFPELPPISRHWRPLTNVPQGQFLKDGTFGAFQSCGWDGMVAPAYDEGPHEELTPKLLDVLLSVQVKTTFFWVGSAIRAHKALAQRAFDEGHHIASKGFSHQSLVTLTLEQVLQDIKLAEVEIKDVVGMRPRYFRPPFGDLTKDVYDTLTGLGYSVVLWNVDTWDWKSSSNPDTILGIYNNEINDLKKSYILSQRDNNADTVGAAPNALNSMLDRGFQLVPLYACLNEPAYQN